MKFKNESYEKNRIESDKKIIQGIKPVRIQYNFFSLLTLLN